MPIWKRPNSKKSDAESESSTPEAPRTEVIPSPVPHAQSVFCLGKSTKLKGELAACVDLEIQGQVEGRVQIDGHVLVVAEGGRAIADLCAREVVVHGQVAGNVNATERIVIAPGGSVLGDISAPSIQLDDGSQFTGSINKGSAPAKVTGSLNGGSAETPPPPPRETSQALMGRQAESDRRGDNRPWGSESRRESARGTREPTPSN